MRASCDLNCTCQTPPNVDLTDAYNSRAAWASSSTVFNQQLLENLNNVGWSPVMIRLSQIPKNSPLQQGCCEALWKHPKETISNLFAPGGGESNPFPNATFRTAESGSAGESSVEPKKSWEIRRCTFYDKRNNNKDKVGGKENTILKDMTQALHSIVTTVQDALQLPSNLLVQEEEEEDGDTSDSDYGCSCRNIQATEPCNVDLLRMFYYDKVQTTNHDNKILGSSAHTDWGTWTVVWQDTVGGLQTFCQSCQTWQDVPPAPKDGSSELLHFVIHVGDATSLAMGHALRKVYAKEESPTADRDDVVGTISWPSPKHRVISPVTEPRASLVYFVYPPPGRSLASLTEGLVPWLKDHAKTSCTMSPVIPYEQYYLLQDQSAGSNHAMRSPREVLDSIIDQPMQQVFADKWNQVQRTY